MGSPTTAGQSLSGWPDSRSRPESVNRRGGSGAGAAVGANSVFSVTSLTSVTSVTSSTEQLLEGRTEPGGVSRSITETESGAWLCLREPLGDLVSWVFSLFLGEVGREAADRSCSL